MSKRSYIRGPASVRFAAKVKRDDATGCWAWTAGAAKGYGRFNIGGGVIVDAHRFSYEHHVGPVPDGLQIDHLCRNTLCVNPAHLEAVTQRENLLRGVGVSATNHRKTHCKHGHPLAGDNLVVHRNRPHHRHCRTCARAASARRRARSA